MFAVWMVETSVHEVVNVIAVRYRLMAAAGTVIMTIATHSRGAADRVAFADLDDVLFNAIAFWMVQMSVLHIVYVVSVTDSDMPAMEPCWWLVSVLAVEVMARSSTDRWFPPA